MQNDKEIEINLAVIFKLLKKNLKWIIICGFMGFVIAFGFTKMFITPMYTSTIKMYVNSNGNTSVYQSSGISINDINASQKLVNTYIVILKDNEVMNKLLSKISQDLSPAEMAAYFGDTPFDKQVGKLKSYISMSSVDDTEVLQIKAETPDPDLSAKICDLMTKVAPEILTRVIKAGSVEVIGSAKPNYDKSSPNTIFNCIIGICVGLLISFSSIILIHYMDNTVKGEEDVADRLSVSVLGEIPDIRVTGKGDYKYSK